MTAAAAGVSGSGNGCRRAGSRMRHTHETQPNPETLFHRVRRFVPKSNVRAAQTTFRCMTMCKHILNAQVAIRSPCCRQWFDCAECHAETQDHRLKQAMEMIFACKKCKKCFRKNMDEFEESDEFCPHCDNHFVLEAVEPKARLEVEGDDVRKDSRMLKDDRVKPKQDYSLWDDEGDASRLG